MPTITTRFTGMSKVRPPDRAQYYKTSVDSVAVHSLFLLTPTNVAHLDSYMSQFVFVQKCKMWPCLSKIFCKILILKFAMYEPCEN
jgi:hypothetical protein